MLKTLNLSLIDPSPYPLHPIAHTPDQFCLLNLSFLCISHCLSRTLGSHHLSAGLLKCLILAYVLARNIQTAPKGIILKYKCGLVSFLLGPS